MWWASAAEVLLAYTTGPDLALTEDDYRWTEIRRVLPDGTLPLADTIPHDQTFNPFGVVITSTRELIVANNYIWSLGHGGISHFFLSRDGEATLVGTHDDGGLPDPTCGLFRSQMVDAIALDHIYVSNDRDASDLSQIALGGDSDLLSCDSFNLVSDANNEPRGVLIDDNGYVLVTRKAWFRRFSMEGGIATQNLYVTINGAESLHGMAFDENGDLLIADSQAGNGTVFRCTSMDETPACEAVITTVVYPLDVAVASDGEVFVGSKDPATGGIYRFLPDGEGGYTPHGMLTTPSPVHGLSVWPAAGRTPALCGDSLINVADEACDDGNSVDGDGCSGVCEIELEYGSCCLPDGRCGTHLSPEACAAAAGAYTDGVWCHCLGMPAVSLVGVGVMGSLLLVGGWGMIRRGRGGSA